jgi:hypothetical protein
MLCVFLFLVFYSKSFSTGFSIFSFLPHDDQGSQFLGGGDNLMWPQGLLHKVCFQLICGALQNESRMYYRSFVEWVSLIPLSQTAQATFLKFDFTSFAAGAERQPVFGKFNLMI